MGRPATDIPGCCDGPYSHVLAAMSFVISLRAMTPISTTFGAGGITALYRSRALWVIGSDRDQDAIASARLVQTAGGRLV